LPFFEGYSFIHLFLHLKKGQTIVSALFTKY
jgi:hypothetical protein